MLPRVPAVGLADSGVVFDGQLDPTSGALAVGAMTSVGQTIQFQLRDPSAADEDRRELLGSAKTELAGQEPIAALLCTCNGRGVGLFGTPNHDAAAMAEQTGPIPVSGFFCNGEIGPVARRTSSTASPPASP